MKKKPERMIIENQVIHNAAGIKEAGAELERVIGQKQILLDFKDKMIELQRNITNWILKKIFYLTLEYF
ncbi:MAG: hypothetical protein IPG85_05500 [Bacteroidetes bacterium]|nr:hypothetical protein [Bacteroidota bacterium]